MGGVVGRGLKCVSDLSSIKSRQGMNSCGQPHISTLSENSSGEMTLSMNSYLGGELSPPIFTNGYIMKR